MAPPPNDGDPHDWSALSPRSLLHTTSLAPNRLLLRAGGGAWGALALGRRQDERQPHPPGHGLDAGHRRVAAAPARPGQRQQSAGAEGGQRHAYRLEEQEGG